MSIYKLMKQRMIFDHIEEITVKKRKKYWELLTDKDKSNFSVFMINRFMSMNMAWTEIINEFQQYSIKPREIYKLYSEVFPKGKVWLTYIKDQNKVKYPEWVVEKICEYFEISRSDVLDYLALFHLTDNGKSELKEILQKYGIEPKEIEKLKL